MGSSWGPGYLWEPEPELQLEWELELQPGLWFEPWPLARRACDPWQYGHECASQLGVDEVSKLLELEAGIFH
jgi:hypothetical protein